MSVWSGGDDEVHKIVDWAVDQFQRENGIDLRPRAEAMERLTEAAKQASLDLASQPEALLQVPFIVADQQGVKNLHLTLTRAELDSGPASGWAPSVPSGGAPSWTPPPQSQPASGWAPTEPSGGAPSWTPPPQSQPASGWAPSAPSGAPSWTPPPPQSEPTVHVGPPPAPPSAAAWAPPPQSQPTAPVGLPPVPPVAASWAPPPYPTPAAPAIRSGRPRLAMASLILGIVTVVIVLTLVGDAFLVWVPTGVIGVILGIVARVRGRSRAAVAGIILSAIGLAAGPVVFIWLARQ